MADYAAVKQQARNDRQIGIGPVFHAERTDRICNMAGRQAPITAAGGVVQVIWDDNRDSRLYRLIEGTPAEDAFTDPITGLTTGLDRFIEDFVFVNQPGFGLLPARIYELDSDPPLPIGTPFRHSIDVWGESGI